MKAYWQLVTPPSEEPVSVTDVKAHARITSTVDDGVIDSFIRTAREEAESYMNRGLLTQTWQYVLNSFAEELYLPMAAPLQNDPLANPSTAPVIQYYDDQGSLQTLATTYYDVDTTSYPGRIVRAANQVWPALQADRQSGRVIITYVVGWLTTDDIPERIKHGIRMYVTSLDADRSGQEAFSTQALTAARNCWSERVSWIEPECEYESWPA